MITIGDKKEFAVQFERSSNKKLGKYCLWINNRKIGYYDEEVYLTYFSDQIKHLLSRNLKITDFIGMEEKEIFSKVYDSNQFENCKLTSFGESFDDFIICVHQIGKNYKFIWKYVDKPFFKYSDYDRRLQKGIVPIKIIEPILDEYLNVIS